MGARAEGEEHSRSLPPNKMAGRQALLGAETKRRCRAEARRYV
jgi:hypothetical protein